MSEPLVKTTYDSVVVRRRRTFGSNIEPNVPAQVRNTKDSLATCGLETQPSIWENDFEHDVSCAAGPETKTGAATDRATFEQDAALILSSLSSHLTQTTNKTDNKQDETHDNDSETKDNPLSDCEGSASRPATEEAVEVIREPATGEPDQLDHATADDSSDTSDSSVAAAAEAPSDMEPVGNSEISDDENHDNDTSGVVQETTADPNDASESRPKDEIDPSDDKDQDDSLETVLAATDKLFHELEDKAAVTVKDVLRQLGVTDSVTKKAVRGRLVELITAWQTKKSDESESEEESPVASDNEYEPEPPQPKKRTTRSAKQAQRRTTKLNKKLQKSAMRIHAEQLRKKRMQELRVRNEELQYESKDQERAEQIAAKFETQTDDQLKDRLSKRVQLWQKLDKKRWDVLHVEKTLVKEDEPPPASEKAAPQKKSPVKESVPVASSDDDSEDDLEIVGGETFMKKLGPPKLFAPPPRKNALAILGSPASKKRRKPAIISPHRSLVALKKQLQSKHKKQGNLWLAQELGYKTEQEHLQDCVQLEERKRQLQLAREEERLKESERKQERLLQLGLDYEEAEEKDGELDEEQATEEKDEEIDEEMEMARQLEGMEPETQGQEAQTQGLDADHEEPDPTNEAATVHVKVTTSATDESTLAEPDVNTEEPPPREGEEDAVPEKDSSVDETKDTAPNADQVGVELHDGNENVPEAASTEREQGNHESNEDGPVVESGDDDNDKIDDKVDEEPEPAKPKGPRNAAWKAMLKKEQERLKKRKGKKGGSLVEEEAEEEEEEEVAGLEDFGFKVRKKKNGDDDEEDADADGDADMEDVVDDLSDNEGDEDAGEKARREQEKKEEKDRHKEILRRMRDGYDGRRGGIAGGGARGMHRFDQLVAADNKEDAKRLGLLNDDELDSDDEAEQKSDNADEEDETALLDKMLKDRFLHRSSVEVEENFSDDEDKNDDDDAAAGGNEQNQEELEQEKLAKRFSKRARMQRLIDAHGHEEEFSQSRLIDVDEKMRMDLQNMKNGLERKRSITSTSSTSNASSEKKTYPALFSGGFKAGGPLAIALHSNRRKKGRTSFVRNNSIGTYDSSRVQQQNSCISFNHVVFRATGDSNSRSNLSASRGSVSSRKSVPTAGASSGSSLWSKAVLSGFKRKRTV